MPQKIISLTADFKAKKGKEAQLRQVLIELVAPSRSEEGCIVYNLHQSTEDTALFVFYEQWNGVEALEQHQESAHFKKAVHVIEELCVEAPRIEMLELL